MKRKKIAIITGGDSLEANSSYKSAKNIFDHLSTDKYQRFIIEIVNWKYRILHADNINTDALKTAVFCPESFTFKIRQPDITLEFDAAFIAIHGAPGETGHLQAYFDMTNTQYTGPGLLSASLSMNKFACKCFLKSAININMPQHILFQDADDNDIERLERVLGYPCIVKPNSSGSGNGVTRVSSRTGLPEAIEKVRLLDEDVLAEEYIDGIEVTVAAVRTRTHEFTLPVAEIARPDDQQSRSNTGNINYTDRQDLDKIIPARLDPQTMDNLQNLTIKIGQILDCKSFYRADFIVSRKGLPYFLELNSIPGMTSKSVFTKQIDSMGMKPSDIYNMVIEDIIPGD